MHLKNGMVCGSQLVTSSALFVLSMLNNSCAIHFPGKDGNYLPFSCIFKASSLHKFTSSSGKSNKSLTTQQDLEHGISHVQKLNLLFHRIFMHID